MVDIPLGEVKNASRVRELNPPLTLIDCTRHHNHSKTQNSSLPSLPAIMPETIPLKCNICPKKPLFSDVSHLLAPSSLRSMFLTFSHTSRPNQGTPLAMDTSRTIAKCDFGPSSDGEPRETIEANDQWYAEWGVEDLMANPMAAKDSEKPGVKAKAADAQPIPSRTKSASSVQLGWRVEGDHRSKRPMTPGGESREIIEAYGQWYAEWGVEDLMADRMAAKGSKKTGVKNRAPAYQPSKNYWALMFSNSKSVIRLSTTESRRAIAICRLHRSRRKVRSHPTLFSSHTELGQLMPRQQHQFLI
ncbi:hypothetical protein EJ08DRAFT_658898 [Tothia fuscella]|uniref:Uncharacterized protein n=1 Tax=Tothia fuscella TaxID=1048955 RepID=A0A9P4NWM3_9PEZI|nr:hypothetical protein EJ08DRAFT_658898 [Tothia fuscella]